MKVFSFQLQSPKAMNIMLLAGLLTYSPLPCLPIPIAIGIVTKEWTSVTELTAAGQSQNYTVFPFNSDTVGDHNDAKVEQEQIIANWQMIFIIIFNS